jgi:DNA-binding response OmpR family regulator/tetratricopeptide (TPR) repeat protein
MQVLRLTSCSVDLDRCVVQTDGGEERGLSTLEVGLIRYLAERPGTDVGRDELVREVWRGAAGARVVDFTVRRLRAKLGETNPPRHILTAHGHGYRFVPVLGARVVSEPVEEVVVPLAVGDLHLTQRRFVRDGRSVDLSRIEALVLEQLAAQLGRPVPRKALIERVWGRGRHEHTLDATIARLRQKLEPDPARPVVLLTARGHGPRLVGAAAATEPTRGNLPPAGTSFVDRPERVAALDALAHHRLVTLVGTAGIGKTTLAREVGAAWLQSHPAAEVWFCDLVRVGSVDGMIARVSATLGAEGTVGPDQIGRVLACRPPGTLVVLDNLEQLVDGEGCAATREVIGRWVAVASAARFLATARVPVGLPDERRVPLHPLELASGVRLFHERAPAADSDPSVVQVLVERLEGLPLAIELAAALTDRMAAATVVERLGASLDLLVQRPEGATSQHSTLRGAIDWSWHLLDAEQQEVLAAVAVFCAPFDAAAAAAVIGRDVEGVLDALVVRSLLRRLDERWALFVSIREFARERLTLGGRLRDATERHAAHFAEQAEPLADDLGGRWGLEASIRLNEMGDDLFAALEATELPDLRGRLALIVSARGFHDNARALHARLSAALERGVSSEHQPRVWLALARLSASLHLTDRADAEIARAEGEYPDAALRVEVAIARAHNADVREEPAVADTWLDAADEALRSLPISRRRAPPSTSPHHLRRRAEIALLRVATFHKLQRIDAWEQAIAEARLLAEELGDAALVAQILRQAARFYWRTGDIEQAIEVCDRAIALGHHARRRMDEAYARLTRVIFDVEVGGFASAERGLAAYEVLANTLGVNPQYAATVRAYLAFERLEFDSVLAMLPEGVSTGILGAWVATTRAATLRWFGRPEEAIEVLLEASKALRTSGDTSLELSLAGASAEAGRAVEAERWLERARRHLDPRAWGVVRWIALTGALVALEQARGTDRWPSARAAARAVLDAGALVRCEDGVLRERPGDVALSRILLERALDRPGGAVRA